MKKVIGIIALFFLSSMLPFASPSNYGNETILPISISEQKTTHATETSVWNETPFRSIAVPNGFEYLNLLDYSDVGVLINNNSDVSKTIAQAFIQARNISEDRIFVFDDPNTPTGETINRNQFETYFLEPFYEMLQNRTNSSKINYLVTTKGIPLRVSGGQNTQASFDQEISLLSGRYNDSIGSSWWITHDYGPLGGGQMEAFTREEYGFFLVTRLTGYTTETALDLIEKANNSLGNRGNIVLDLATNRNGSGYKFWNDDLYVANTTLNGTYDLPVYFDEETEFVTNVSNVIGYASWGSNDGNWNANRLPNAGFDTTDTSWSTDARYWSHTLPSTSGNESIGVTTQNQKKQGGQKALSISFTPDCSGQNGSTINGVLAEYFDNRGLTINSNQMPDLNGRHPNAVHIQQNINFGSSYSAHTGVDSRFKETFSARFTASLEIPEEGNWSFYLNSDDGSELWINGESVIQNHGYHGMREISNYTNLSAGFHEIRVEFFQGGGPHGVILSWEGPNQTKSPIPQSSFQVFSQRPLANEILHSWDFETGSGSTAFDGRERSNLTLFDMNASNWVNCPNGGCLFFDGIDDYAQVDVEDWSGNITVSQFVLVEDDNQSTYASAFTIGDVAGSNQTFQHMIQNGEWYVHSNTSSSLSPLKLNQWMHLATVYDNGTVYRYVNGQLIGSFQALNSTFNNIDLYRLGVNRAGSSFFKGYIDNVVVYDQALHHQDIHQLSRQLYKNCGPLSSAGNSDIEIWQNVTLPENHTDHAWIIYGYGSSEGEMSGSFELLVEAYDINGSLVSQNQSSSQILAENWNSRTMRFRPHEDATQFNISVIISPSGSNADGNLIIDTLNLRAIRPHNGWVNGSIAETAVSTGGRSFTWGTNYGQSLIADLLEDGVSGVKGYVYEPYLTAVGYPSVLLESYAQGYNLAESHAAANLVTGWMGVVVGDPKMAPYADQFHDVNIIDARLVNNANENTKATVEIALENIGMAPANGSLLIVNVQGNVILNQSNISIPKGDIDGSRLIMNIDFTVPETEYLNLRVRWENSTPERNFKENIVDLGFPVNAKPVITDGFCSASELARGGYTICNIFASDDENVTSVQVEWRVGQTGAWTLQNATFLTDDRWEIIVTIPTDSNLGYLSLQAYAYDRNGLFDFTSFPNVTEILNATQTWYGPFIEGLDAIIWDRASALPTTPPNGMVRGQSYDVLTCVKDEDFDSEFERPELYSNKGNLTILEEVPSEEFGVFCYEAKYELPHSPTLEEVEFRVYDASEQLVSFRTVNIADISPLINISIETDEGTSLDRLLNNGREFIRIHVQDDDDENSSFVGDIRIMWPGGELLQFPLDIEEGENETRIQLSQVQHSLESGQFWIQVSGIGRHGATATSEVEYPVILTPPSIVTSILCDEIQETKNMTFGKTATWVVVTESDRPIEIEKATLIQEGWVVEVPTQSEPSWGENVSSNCSDLTAGLDQSIQYFRVKLDSTFVEGDGELSMYVKDVDGLVHTLSQDVFFSKAPTILDVELPSNISAGDDLLISLFVSDDDGLSGIICSVQLIDKNQDLLSQFLQLAGDDGQTSGLIQWVYPIPRNVENSSITLNFECINEQFEPFEKQSEVFVEPYIDPCIENQTSEGCQDKQQTDTSSQENNHSLLLAFLCVIGAIVVTGIVLLRRNDDNPQWDILPESGEEQLTETDFDQLFDRETEQQVGEKPEFVPQDWSIEQFSSWLEGPVPEQWTPDQWSEYVEIHRKKITEFEKSNEKHS